jgi:hypothetical protein
VSLTTTFAGYAFFLSAIIVVMLCFRAMPEALGTTSLTVPFVVVAVGLVAIASGIFSITQTGKIKRHSVQAERLTELCSGASLEIRRTVSGVDNLYVDSDYAPQFRGGTIQASSLGYGFLTSGYLQFLERKELGDKGQSNLVRLRQASKAESVTREMIASITADYVVTSTPLISESDKSLHLLGSEVRIENRKTNELLGRLRYFGMNELPYKFCPSFGGDLDPSLVVLYVLGLGPENVRAYAKRYLQQ